MLGLFKSSHISAESIAEHLKKGKNLWFFTRSKRHDVNTCAVETLIAHMKMNGASVNSVSIEQLQGWLMAAKHGTGQWGSFNRILTDLNLPD